MRRLYEKFRWDEVLVLNKMIVVIEKKVKYEWYILEVE